MKFLRLASDRADPPGIPTEQNVDLSINAIDLFPFFLEFSARSIRSQTLFSLFAPSGVKLFRRRVKNPVYLSHSDDIEHLELLR